MVKLITGTILGVIILIVVLGLVFGWPLMLLLGVLASIFDVPGLAISYFHSVVVAWIIMIVKAMFF